MKHISLVLLFLVALIGESHSIVPLESLLLGDLSEQYKEKVTDPIAYIFRDFNASIEITKKSDPLYSYKEKLSIYRGFAEEAENLNNFCKERPKVQYPVKWDREQAKRSFLATLQYIGLDLTMRAIPKYAKFFEFSRGEYINLGENLIGNYCSQNLSIISIRQLKKNWNIKYNSEGDYQLPSIDNDPLFPKTLSGINTKSEYMKQEFSLTIDLFKSFCSWGNDIFNLRLLVPLVRHPVVMSFLNRQINNKKLSWESLDNKFFKDTAKSSIQVFCDNLICRKMDTKSFVRRMPRGAGTLNMEDDFNRLYCEDFRDADFVTKEQVPKIRDFIIKYSFDEQNLLVNQFISLITGVPDLLARAKKFTDGKKFLKTSIEKSWNKWATTQNSSNNNDLFFEESLTVELVNRDLFFNRFQKKFKVMFDVNLGEFDRVNQIVGKIRTTFNLNLSKKFLLWARAQWIDMDPRDKKSMDFLFSQFRTIIKKDVAKARNSLEIPPWKGDIENLIIREVLAQIVAYKGFLYGSVEPGIVQVPVQFNYAPFALRYIRYQFNVNENEGDREARKRKLRSLKL